MVSHQGHTESPSGWAHCRLTWSDSRSRRTNRRGCQRSSVSHRQALRKSTAFAEHKYMSKERARMPAGSKAILSARTLTTAHAHLATLLRPGLGVLDVGCGTGSITAGIAEAVAPDGYAIGIDINTTFIEEARRSYKKVANLSFAVSDAYSVPFHNAFDIVNAARALQWLSSPADAFRMLVAATKPRGRVVVLDYNHEKIVWEPTPP